MLRPGIGETNGRLWRRGSTLLFIAAMFGSPATIPAKDKRVKRGTNEPQDKIEVLSHLPLKNGTVRQFVLTRHYSSYYLYAEYDQGKGLTLIDITNPAKPLMIADTSYPASTSLFAAAGTAALVIDSEVIAPAPKASPQTIRIMDFSDPRHPVISREITGVTALAKGDYGLIFLANSEGLWILRQELAPDPAVQREYERQLLYNH